MTRTSMSLGALICATFVVSAAILFAAPPAQQPASKPSGDFSANFEKVVKELITQSEGYTNKPGSDLLFQWTRPQKIVADLKADNAPAVLDRMLKPFTKDEWQDSYIRFHLMPLILDAPESQRKAMGKDLVELSKLVPCPALGKEVRFAYRNPVTDEPKEIAEKYRNLVNSCVFYKGFPPFQVAVGPPDSLALMDADRRRKCEAMWAEAQTLKDKFTTKIDNKLNQWNSHAQFVPWFQQELRGEVFQAMVRTGDASTLTAAMNYMALQAKANPRFASDMVTFLNASYLNGEFSAYDASAQKATAAKLKALALQYQKWETAGKRQERNLAEAAFHFVKSIEAGHTVAPPPKNAVPAEAPKAPTTQRTVTADNLDIDTINDAIRRATYALMLRNPPDAHLSWQNWAVLGIPYYPWHLIYSGQQALIGWALLACEEPAQSPFMQKKINWVMADDTSITYDRAMRLQMLRFLPRKGWEDWVKRDRDGLVASITSEGNFPQSYNGTKAVDPFGENANGSYGVMGLIAAETLGEEVPKEAWKIVDKYWREAQFRSPKEADGGWAQISFKSLKMGVDPGVVGKVSGPMTAGGILALSQTERFINAGKADVGMSFSPQLLKGIDWLDHNFNLEGASEADQDWFYYMWTIQNVGHVTGYRRFKKIDYYRDATARLLNSQRLDGLWTGPKGEGVSTSFALLYLYRARGPLAMCKLHFTSTEATKDKSTATSWNNRPNDLVNFADYLTETFETPTSWLVAEPAQPVVELIESPTLYLATDKGFTLSDDDVARLRQYVEAGGLIVCVPEGNKPAPPLASMKALSAKLFPGREAEKIDSSHPFFNLAAKVKSNYTIETVSNGIRPLMVIIEKDIGRDLQANNDRGKDSFALLANIYLYAAGRDSRRPRLASNYVVRPSVAPARKVSAARIKYDGSFDPEPLALPQLSALMARDHGIDLTTDSLSADELSPKQQIAFLTISEKTNLSDAHTAALRKWIDAGGTLWVDVAGGDGNSGAQLDSVVPRLVADKSAYHSLNDQRILSGVGLTKGYDVRRLTRRKFDAGRAHDPIMVATVNGRPAIYVSRQDVACGLAGLNHWGISGFEPLTARHLVINTILAALEGPTTKPTTMPTTSPAARPSVAATPTSKPTTKP